MLCFEIRLRLLTIYSTNEKKISMEYETHFETKRNISNTTLN